MKQSKTKSRRFLLTFSSALLLCSLFAGCAGQASSSDTVSEVDSSSSQETSTEESEYIAQNQALDFDSAKALYESWQAKDFGYADYNYYKAYGAYYVKKSNDIVTVREELELVDHYIYILNVRFSGDIHYGKEIEEDLLDSCMPSMILQPIVENSVNHGIREMNGEGKIRLKVYHVDGDTLGISIRDNGIGMDRDTIEKVLGGNYHEEQSGGGSNGIAMGNVIARLKLFTQNEDVMTILSDGKDQGTEVILYLPIKEREKTDV